mmetsp:Transcript_58994/g.95444  ORF Transcript_58994/g.95444 Transcript_58994/m.95444 type:complete len:226 (+) Transcript_58994:88-765(+)
MGTLAEIRGTGASSFMEKVELEQFLTGEGAPTGIPKSNSNIVKCENKPGHRPFGTYNLPKWVRHPDAQKPAMYLQPEDFMGSKKRHNVYCWNVAHIGAQCAMFEGQGFKMLEKATPEEINAKDNLEGWTPLCWAVLSDNPKAVIWLLKHGADKDIKDNQGRTAEELVEDHWGDFYQRYWGHMEKKEGLPQPDKVLPKRLKQMKDAFKLQFAENEFDIEGYKAIQV